MACHKQPLRHIIDEACRPRHSGCVLDRVHAERRVPYIISLLQEGLSIPEEKLRVGNGREGWTLGAALAEGGRIGIGRPILEQVWPAQCYP
jgi:hypothetical protein